MLSKQVQELLAESMATLQEAGLPFFFFARCDDGALNMVSPGMAKLCVAPAHRATIERKTNFMDITSVHDAVPSCSEVPERVVCSCGWNHRCATDEIAQKLFEQHLAEVE